MKEPMRFDDIAQFTFCLWIPMDKRFFYFTQEVTDLPNAAVLKEKQAIVAELAEKMKTASAGVLVDYKGINVANDTKLRRELRNAGVEYSVVKNTLTKLAAHQVGFEALDEHLNGTTALAISPSDPVAAAKILHEYAKNSNGAYTIKVGFVDGKVITAAEVEELATIPSREGLLTKLLYCLTNGPRSLAIALNAIAEKNSEGTAEAVEAPAEA